MRSLDMIPTKNAFPALYWNKGRMFLAENPINLYTTTRSAFRELAQVPPGRYHLMDCTGKYFDIDGWERIKPFGGVKMLFERVFGYVFMVPILANERQLSLDEFNAKIVAVAENRFRYDIEPYALGDIKEGVPNAQSYFEALQVVKKAILPS